MDVVINHIYRNAKSFNNQYGYGWMISYYGRIRPVSNGDVLILDGGESRNVEYKYVGESMFHRRGILRVW